ncbi:MAG: DUF3015 domain-containing protein [Leptospirales bacterium]|nr:DUF3015 domain-containing protein [Leptospirales bacterium]
MKKLFASVTMVFLLTSSVFAADNIGPGLGRVLLKGNRGKVMELLGTFLNGLCGNGTFAITTGTLGYQNGAAIGMNEEVKTFVAQNMDGLATDIAKGEGEYLDALGVLVQVEDKVAFNSKMKANFRNIYTAYGLTSDEVAENILKVAEL